jgi:hypothetical protein
LHRLSILAVLRSLLVASQTAITITTAMTTANISTALTTWETDATSAAATCGNIVDSNTAAVLSATSAFNQNASSWNMACATGMPPRPAHVPCPPPPPTTAAAATATTTAATTVAHKE